MPTTPAALRFDRFRLVPPARCLLREGARVPIGARALDVLLALVERRGSVVTKYELMAAVWPGLVVEDNRLQAQVSALRKVLGASAIATIPGRGYRFVETVEEEPVPDATVQSTTPTRDDRALAPAYQVPCAVSSFVGRQRELAEVGSRVRSGARLLTLTGPGGCGKTRLALEASALLRLDFRGGIFWVDLASAVRQETAIERIAQALGAGADLGAWIGARKMLVILDNFEQIVAAGPELSALLSRCPNLALLVTSRALLRLGGEIDYALPPLLPAEAVALFCERADVVTSPAIERLCASLDNMPLAVELAAARMNVLSAEQLLGRLSSRLDLLRGGRDGIARHRSLRSTIEWSYRTLSSEEQRVLARLSVFPAVWTLEAAEEVADATLDCLQSLVEKSLVRHEAGRYSMLQTIAQFAAECLDDPSERSDLRDRHARCFGALASKLAPDARRTPGIADVLRNDLDNFLAALEWLSSQGAGQAQLGLAMSLAGLWLGGGFHATGKAVLERALREAPPDGSARLGARALRTLGDIAIDQGDYDAAQRQLEEALRRFEECGAQSCMPVCLVELGMVAKCKGDTVRAAELFARGIEASRFARNKSSLAWALVNRGALLVDAGDLIQGEAACRESLALNREAGDELGCAGCLFTLGRASLLAGDAVQASALFQESLGLHVKFGSRIGAAQPLAGLAAILATLDREHDAASILGAISADLDRSGIRVEASGMALMHSTKLALADKLGATLHGELAREPVSFDRAVELALA